MAKTKRKVVEKSKVGEQPKTEEPQVETVVAAEEIVDIKETTTPEFSNNDLCIFVKLSDGVMIDLVQIQGYVHEEGTMGRVYLKGGNNFQTPCGDELVKLIRRHRMYG